ncbi:MAG: hypothetical protein HZA08_04575 [Nitrospirae bacterium]|nr:hypothetical protein [Nitrospirota bacterium]
MAELKIKLSDKDQKALEELARDNATDPETFIHAQLVHLIRAYRGKGLTPGMKKHLNASIKENLNLLKRLAQ